MSVEKAYLEFDSFDKERLIDSFDNILLTIKERISKLSFFVTTD